jgi:hypothetical protein
VSLCLIAGCTAPSGGPIVPTDSAATGNVVSPGGGNVVAPGSGNAPEGVALAFTAIQGQATFHGKPLANAEIRILDARTDTPAVIAPGSGNVIAPGGGNVIAPGGGNVIAPGGGNVIAPGGGNVIAPGSGNVIAPGGGNVIAPGGGNVIAAGGGNLRTDAQGNFSLNVAGLSGGGMARLVVVAGGNAMTTLVSDGGAIAPMGYKLQQTGGVVTAPINEVTTTVSHLAYGALRLSRLVKPSVGAPLVTTMMQGLQAEAAKYDAAFKAQPNTANSLLEETDPLTGAPRNVKHSIIPTLLANTNTKKAVFALNKNLITGIARGVADPESQASDLETVREEVQDVPFVGTGLSASAGAGAITLATTGGQTVSLDLKDTTSLDATLSSTTFTQALEPAATTSSGTSTATPPPPPPPPPGPVYPPIAAGPLSFMGNPPISTSSNPSYLAFVGAQFFVGRPTGASTGVVQRIDPAAPANDTSVNVGLPGPVVVDRTNLWLAENEPGRITRIAGVNGAMTVTHVPMPSYTPPAAGATPILLKPKLFHASHDGATVHVVVSDPPMNLISYFRMADANSTPTSIPEAEDSVALFGLSNPEGVLVDGTTIWVVGYSGGTPKLLGLDLNGVPLAGFGGGIPIPGGTGPIAGKWHHLVKDTVGNLWISDPGSHQVMRYNFSVNPAGGAFTSYQLPAGSEPADMVPDGGRVWVLNRGNNTVSLIDPAASPPLRGTLSLGFMAGGISPAGGPGYLYVTNRTGATIHKIMLAP